ncbi:tetratricopeptide repeat protein [soil metagenome]
MTTARRRWLPPATVALLSLAATVTSAGHDFTYDDRSVILENARVHSLAHIPQLFAETYWPAYYGGDGYRPLVTSMFTLQWVAADGSPWVFHLLNILLAVAVTIAMYWCARAVLPTLGAWVAAALFAVHPVHVEVTGNVVGQSELIVALCLLVAIGLYVRARRAPVFTTRDNIAIQLLFATALLAKEHAMVLPAILLVAEATVIPDADWRARLRKVRTLMLALVAIALAYLLVRGRIQSDLAGFLPYPVFRFLHMRAIDRIGTMMNEIPRIAQLILFPVHLSADYSPPDVLVAEGPALSQLPGLFICLSAVLLATVLRRRAPVVSFGLAWVIVSFLPVSNLIIPAGFITAERTLFLPSAGAVLMGGALAEYVARHASPVRRRFALAGLVLLLAAGVVRSIQRQKVWKNNEAFFVALMADASNGYRAHFIHGRYLGLNGHLRDMEMEYRRAIRMFPYDAGMTLSVADAYTRAGLCGPAVALFEWTFGVRPESGEGRYEYVYCLAKLNRWADVRREALNGLRLVPARDVHLMRAAVVEANMVLKPSNVAR